MLALFAPGRGLVGWLRPDAFVFDREMVAVAFIRKGHAWSMSTGNWLGPVDVSTLQDRNGRPVAWNPDHPPETRFGASMPGRPMKPNSPVRPMRPLQPVTPITPTTPAGGWSHLTFAAWLDA